MKHYLGIDLGGTAIAVGVIREDYSFASKHSIPTSCPRPFEAIVKDMVQAGRKALEMAGLTEADVDYVGLGVPSTINQTNNRVVFANNLGWKNLDVIAEFQKSWDIPAYVANDADAAALAEVIAGAARDFENILMLTLGTGVGGGIIFRKKLYTGGDGFGSEPGHTIVVADGEPCTCGRKGCLEAYASVTALIRDTKRAMAEHPESAMHGICGGDPAKVSGRTAFDAARQGDPAGLALVERYIHYLAVGVSSLIILLRPQAVILGGGVCNEGEYLFGPLRAAVEPMVYAHDIIGVPKILKAGLGNDAGIIGAALLGVRKS